jgi:hypothetical protein
MAQDEFTQDDEFKLFFMELGLTIVHWAGVEDGLRVCALSGFKKKDHPALSLGFLSIENFRPKLEFADKVIQRKHGTNPLGAPWPTIADKLRQGSYLRNKIAHRAVLNFPHGKPGRRLVLQPWIYQKPKFKTRKPMPPPGSLGLMDIIKARLEFYALVATLNNFAARLSGKPELFPKSSEQAEDPPTIQMLARLSRGALKDPLQP